MEVELRRSASENVNLLLLLFLFIWPSAFRNMALLCWSHGNQIRSRFSVWTVKRSLRASDSLWVESISQCCPDLSTGVSCVCADTGHWPSSVVYLSFLKSIRVSVSEYRASLNYQLKPSLRDRSNSTKEFSSDLIDMNQLGKQRGHYQNYIQEFTKNCLASLSFLSLFPFCLLLHLIRHHLVVWQPTTLLTNTDGGCLLVAASNVKTFKVFATNFGKTQNCKIIVSRGWVWRSGDCFCQIEIKRRQKIGQILLPKQLLDIWRHLLGACISFH